MIRVVHLIDDVNTGGVTKVASDMARALGPGFDIRVMPVATAWKLPPRLDADIVVVDFTMSWAKLAFLLALRLARPSRSLVVVEHSYCAAYERLKVEARTRFRTLLRLSYRFADRVVAVSEGQAGWLRAARLVNVGRLVVIPQALDLAALETLPAPSVWHTLRLGAYGRYVPQKGFDQLIAAMRLVPPEIATLRLAGYGEDEAYLRAMARDLPHVSLAEPFEGPAGFLADVDVVVVPSRWEPYGLVAQEARAAGRPVIASGVDGLVEQVTSGLGMLVPPEDPPELAAAIVQMAAIDRAAMGAAARASVAGLYTSKLAAWRGLLETLAVSHFAKAQSVHIGNPRALNG
jgi:glycosyltransferase involved in cell wall biosynthesis